mgnify:CR=1 FL=1
MQLTSKQRKRTAATTPPPTTPSKQFLRDARKILAHGKGTAPRMAAPPWAWVLTWSGDVVAISSVATAEA